MDNRIRYLLLKAIKEDGNIANLEKMGYHYAEIAHGYSGLINEGLLTINDKMKFILSDSGEMELVRLQDEIVSSGRWRIEPYLTYKTEKMDLFDIFID